MNTWRSPNIENPIDDIYEKSSHPKGDIDRRQAEQSLSFADKNNDRHEPIETTDDELGDDNESNQQFQDTPGRAKTASSRQQTSPDQQIQTGSSDLDKSSSRRRSKRR